LPRKPIPAPAPTEVSQHNGEVQRRQIV